MIKVLVVEDSEVQALLIKTLIAAEHDMEVIGHATNGEKAVKLTKQLKPDIITMDVEMPVMDGLTATQEIMSKTPTPIIVVSSKANDAEMNVSFTALEAGALGVIQKPVGPQVTDFTAIQEELINTLRTMAGIKVVTRRANLRKPLHAPQKKRSSKCQVVALGASTGGPIVIRDILYKLPKPFATPVVVVQHLSKGFLTGYVNWLKDYTQVPIEIAENNAPLKPGRVYFAPDDSHLTVTQRGNELIARLSDDGPVNGFKPSVDVLFNSIAELPCGALAGILTGMGNDGSKGLLAIHKKGKTTFAQDEASCVVFGMPKVAIKLDAVNEVLPAKDIASYIEKYLK